MAGTVVLKGLSIEVLNFGYIMKVQDGYRKNVDGASVFVTDLEDFLEKGFTDSKGLYYGFGDQNVTYLVTVLKEGFLDYGHRFRIIPSSALTFPTKNFPVLVFDGSGQAVQGATVTVQSQTHTDSGSTSANGLYQGVVKADRPNTITISKSGFTTYSQALNPYIKITVSLSQLIAVPVIVLN